jgi:AcrR family transcriptional regulator
VKQRILEEAVEQFAAKGFRGTSMRDLDRAVGIKESFLYIYYVGKDSILRVILDYRLQGVRTKILTREESGRGRLRPDRSGGNLAARSRDVHEAPASVDGIGQQDSPQ